jgi:hypothetical protein
MQYRLLLAAALTLAGCRSYDTATAPNGSASPGTPRYDAGQAPRNALPLQELAQAKAAAARYHDVRKAIADGYRDTGIVLPNMGRHFLNDTLLDTKFEADHPELLVYTSDSTNLLALEYAQPLSETPPEGFQGDKDQWVPFGGVFWTLHAWVWKDNPDGVFNPTNSRAE